MKKGYSFCSFGEGDDLRECMKACSDAGYDGVELVIRNSGELTMKTTDTEMLAIKEMACDFNLDIVAVCSGVIWGYNLVSEDVKIREKAKEAIVRQLETAAILGADSILTIPGFVKCDFAPPMPRVPYNIAYERSQEMLSSLIPLAKSCNVVMAVENIWNRFLLSPLEMGDFIDEIGSEHVGVYFDVGNIIYIGFPEDWIYILGKRIKKLHFCDFKMGGASLSNFVDLLEGDVDYVKVMEALKSIGYNDYATLEMFPNYPMFPMHSIVSGKLAMDLIFEL